MLGSVGIVHVYTDNAFLHDPFPVILLSRWRYFAQQTVHPVCTNLDADLSFQYRLSIDGEGH